MFENPCSRRYLKQGRGIIYYELFEINLHMFSAVQMCLNVIKYFNSKNNTVRLEESEYSLPRVKVTGGVVWCCVRMKEWIIMLITNQRNSLYPLYHPR